MKRSTVIMIIIALLAIGGLVFILIPRSIERAEPEQAEYSAAVSYLRSLLEEERHSYAYYLAEYEGKSSAAGQITSTDGAGRLEARQSAVFTINAPASGLYTLTLDCLLPENSFIDYSLSLLLNGEEPFFEARSLSIPVYWQDATKDFPTDRYGDETAPEQVNVGGWRSYPLYGSTYITDHPLCFWLEAGQNVVELVNTTARGLELGALTATAWQEPASYADYIAGHSGAAVVQDFIGVNATDFTQKNSPYIQHWASLDGDVTPSDPINKKINVIDIMETGATAYFTVSVPESGLYAVALHMAAYDEDFSSFITLAVNGEVPFRELYSCEITPDKNGRRINAIFGNAEGEPYYIYLEAGEHELSFRPEAAPLKDAIADIQLLIDHVNEFSLNIKRITGREVDTNRTWRLTRFIPETEEILNAYDTVLRGLLGQLGVYSQKGANSSVLSDLTESLAYLDKMREKPDELPLYLEILSGSTSSVLQAISSSLDKMMGQGFELDYIYLYNGTDELPAATQPILAAMGDGIMRIVASFVSPKYSIKNEEGALNVWVNRTALHVDAIQKMADTGFELMPVNVSVMPDVNKLVLAAAAGTSPDVALGVQSHTTFDLSSRGAVLDLTGFDDFWQIAAQSVPGAYTGVVFNDGVYGLPESLDVSMLVYREDVMRQLGLEVPDTWTDVTEMMSELQRYDMSFYLPIATGDGYKWFYQTTPLIYQNGGRLYLDDGTGAAINEPGGLRGLTLLGDLFTTFALVEQVPSFFSSFRYSQTPIGLIDLNNYVMLKSGAPELTGQWRISLQPGVENEDGEVERWSVINAWNSIIFKSSENQNEAWEYLKWWMSTEVQQKYVFDMQMTYGLYIITANLEALAMSPIPSEDLEVILEAVQWVRDTPRSPGQYLLERSISDIWNTMVFDGTPAQIAIDIRMPEIQREFRRKMTEIGLLDENGVVEGYHVREIDWVIEKMREGAR